MVVFREAEVVLNGRDNVTPALNLIDRLIGRLSNASIDLNLGKGVFDSIEALQDKISALGEKILVDVDLATNADDALAPIAAGADKAANSVSAIGAAGKAAGNELETTQKKSAGFFESMQRGSQQVGDALGNIQAQFAALAITGAIGGFSWLSAKGSAQYQSEVIANIGARNGAKEGAMAEKFVGQAGENGQEYASGTDRANLLSFIELNTKLRNEKAMAATRGIEKLAFSSDIAEKKGYDAESLMRIGTRKNLRNVRPDMANDINAIFGKDFTKKSLTARLKIIADFDKKIDIEDAMKEDPEKVFKLKLSRVSKGIGETMIGPMNSVLNVANNLVTVLEKVPLLKEFAGYGLMAMTAVLGMGLLANAVSSASGGLMLMARAIGFAKAEEGGLVIAQRARAASTWLGAVASRAASTANLVAAAATRLLSANTISDVAISNASFLTRLRMVGANLSYSASAIAATGGLAALTAAETTAAAGATVLAAAEGVATAPLWPFILAGVVLAGVLAVVAAKAGFLKPLLDGFGKIKFGKAVDDFAKGDFGKAWDHIAKGFKFPSLSKMMGNLAGDKLTASLGLSLAAGPLAMIAKTLEKIFGVSDLSKTALDTGTSLWKKLVECLTWIYDTVKGAFKWISDGLGITKSKKQEKVDKIAADAGLHQENGVWWKGNVKADNPQSGTSRDVLANLRKAEADVKKAPDGIFDNLGGRIADAIAAKLRDLGSWVKEALAGVWDSYTGEGSMIDSIVSAISTGFESVSEVFDTVGEIFDGIQANLPSWLGGKSTDASAPEGESFTDMLARKWDETAGGGKSTEPAQIPEPVHAVTEDMSTWRTRDFGSITKYQNPKTGEWQVPASASGSEVLKDGLAMVHAGNQITAAKLGRPGKLNDVIGKLQSTGSGRSRSGPTISVGGSTFNINNPVVPDTAAAYHLTDILKRELDPFIEESVKRKIGQYIT